ncbi:MAG: DegV family EDD domain-containing protein [Erysipelotrichaceae bacterium]|nr:DegV family EDD domain-containing protein [Erysipelotrichaceae bacterium]MDY5252314.1 DegV family protein [Erysipelotrichaceae bacterium]
MKIAYITDTGTGKDLAYFEDQGIFCLPLQITDEQKNYQDMEQLRTDELVSLLKAKKVLSTSLPALGNIVNLMQRLKDENYDLVIAVCICNGLSSTIDTLKATAKNFDLKLICIDTYVTAVVQEYLIIQIKKWFEAGQSLEEILPKTEAIIASCNTLILPSDMQHLKRGGRLNATAALLAGLLKIVPILKINKDTNGKIDVLDKVRTYQKALGKTIENIQADINEQEDYLITIAHVNCPEKAQQVQEMISAAIPCAKTQIIKLCNVVSVHTGLDCIAIQYFKQIH